MKIINVAVDASKKMVKKPSDEDDADDEGVMSVKEVLSEIETLRTLRHDAILRLISVYVQPEEKHVYVVTELLHGGAVLDAILKMKDERYTEAEAKVTALLVAALARATGVEEKTLASAIIATKLQLWGAAVPITAWSASLAPGSSSTCCAA